MSLTTQRMRRGVFGALVAGALGFGAAEAFATPPQENPLRCDSGFCQQLCTTIGYGNGFCSRGSCFCYG
jgi:hypothetical protein